MPVVRKYQRQAQTAALPGARLTAAETAASLGKAGGATAEALTRLGGTVAQAGIEQYTQIRREEKQKADTTWLLDASNQLDQFELDKLHDEQHGALNIRGKASFTLPESIDDDFNKVAGEIEKGAGNDEQRVAFAKMKAERGMNIAMSVRRHVAGEMQTYKMATLKGTMENAHNLAIVSALDPPRVRKELAKGVDAITAMAPDLGISGPALDAQIADFRSGVHVGVINNLLANEETARAEDYFKGTKREIAGDQIDAVTNAINVGSVKEEAQKETAKILAAGGTFEEQRTAAKAIAKPDVQDEVLHRIEHERDVKDKAERDTEEQTLKGVYNTLDKAKDVAAIPANIWSQMTGPERSAARGYARALAKGESIETDWPTYYALVQQARDDPTTFAGLNLMKARGRLDDGDFKQLAGWQLSMRNQDGGGAQRATTERELDGFRTRKELLDSSLTSYGIDPAAKPDTAEGKAIAELRRLVDRRVVAAQSPDSSGKRKEVSNTEVQQVIDDILSSSSTTPGTWRALIQPFTYDLRDQTRSLINTTIADVPLADKQAIEASLRRRGLPISDPVIVDTYIEGQLHNRGRK